MPLDLHFVRSQFPSLSLTDGGRPRLYFDNPAGSQVPHGVVARMADCLLRGNANIGGGFRTSERAGRIVAAARQAAADLLNAPSPDEIVFGQNMTSLTLHVARALGREFRAGDEIVVTRMDHDANVEPWCQLARDRELTVRWLPFDTDTFEFDLAALDTLLGERTRLVCAGAASNLTGTLNDVTAICAAARRVGALTFIDGVQSVPHVGADVQDIGCDFFVCSAYKFFGPHQGVLWGRGEVLRQLRPDKVRPAPDELPWRFEPGTQSHEGIAGTAAAIDYLASLGGDAAGGRRQALLLAWDAIGRHEAALSARLIGGLEDLPGVTVHGIRDPSALDRRVPTISFTHARIAPAEIASALAARNVFAWSGHNYAVEAAQALGVLDTGGVVRLGAVHYNTLDEIDGVLDALGEILA